MSEIKSNPDSSGMDPAFREFLGGLGKPEEWNRLSPENRRMMHQRFTAQQAKTGAPTELQTFERALVARHGPEFRSHLTSIEKMTYAELTGTRNDSAKLSPGERLVRELAGLKTNTKHDSNVNIQMARLTRIREIEKKLGIES